MSQPAEYITITTTHADGSETSETSELWCPSADELEAYFDSLIDGDNSNGDDDLDVYLDQLSTNGSIV